MAILEDPEWNLAHIQNSFIIDQSGTCESGRGQFDTSKAYLLFIPGTVLHVGTAPLSKQMSMQISETKIFQELVLRGVGVPPCNL